MQYYQVPDLKNNDIRRLARRSLSGKWTKAMIPMLIITVALLLPALIQYQDLLSSGVLNADNMQDLQNVIDRLESRESGFLYSVLSLFSFLLSILPLFSSFRIVQLLKRIVSRLLHSFQ